MNPISCLKVRIHMVEFEICQELRISLNLVISRRFFFKNIYNSFNIYINNSNWKLYKRATATRTKQRYII